MDLYHVALFVHVIGAIIVVGTGLVAWPLGAKMRSAQTVGAFRDWGELLQKLTKIAPKGAGALLITGVYMGISQFSFTNGWLAVSLALFIVAGGLASVIDKHLDRTLELAAAAPEGPVPPEILQEAENPRMYAIESVMLGMDVTFLFLMTNKPGWTGSLVVAAVGFAIGGAMVARHTRSRGRAPAVAA